MYRRRLRRRGALIVYSVVVRLGNCSCIALPSYVPVGRLRSSQFRHPLIVSGELPLLFRPYGRAEAAPALPCARGTCASCTSDECSRRPLLRIRALAALVRPCTSRSPLKGPGGVKRIKTKVQWTFVPLNGLATNGQPWTCKREQGKRSAASRRPSVGTGLGLFLTILCISSIHGGQRCRRRTH